jgi:hypothetical protein
MKSFILKSIVVLFFVSMQTSCISEDDNQCYLEFVSYATAVTGPETAAVNEEITFEVTYRPFYGCATFVKFEEGNQENIYFINIIDQTTECNCVTEPTLRVVNYTFTPTTPGEFIFRFKRVDNTTIIKNVIVE